MMIEIVEGIYFNEGKIHYEIVDSKDKALIDSLKVLASRPPISFEQAEFLIDCILKGEYIPLICGASLGCWTGKGYYANNRYKKWYKWNSSGMLGAGFYQATFQTYIGEDGFVRDNSTIISKFINLKC